MPVIAMTHTAALDRPPDTEMPVELDSIAKRMFGHALSQLLLPIDLQRPAGPSLRSSGLHAALEAARRQDDPSLPLGPWQHELQRADWPAIARQCADTLAHRSKDLQLGVWLLEAQLHLNGIAAVAPCLRLLQGLIANFPDLHPQPGPDGAPTHRANLLRSLNRRLSVTLRLVPFVATEDGRVSWDELERALRIQPAPICADTSTTPATEEATEVKRQQQMVSATPASHVAALWQALDAAYEAAEALRSTIDDTFEESPSIASFCDVLARMLAWADAELRRRGIALDEPAEPSTNPPTRQVDRVADIMRPPLTDGVDRAQAYAMLAAAAEALRRIDPHSPVPYVVQRAIAWGSLNTAELYQELFIRLGGQISIFELLGVALPDREAA